MLLILTVSCGAFFANSQVSVTGVSPAAVVGDYVFTWADPAGGDWTTPDFNIAGTFVQDTLMFVDTGEPGTNPQGHPIAQEGCAALVNDLTGKIAVLYRNTCEFGAKAKFAQDAGAVGVIIINRDDEAIAMGGGVEGLNVTIPTVMIPSSAGNLITAQMGLGPVVMFLGNKVGLYPNDAGSNRASIMLPPTGTTPKFIADNGNAFMIGIELLNYGSNSNAVSVTATIDGPSGNVYDETVGPITMATGDTLSIFDGNPNSFPQFDLATYEAGDYTLTYSITLGSGADDAPDDNTFSQPFSISADGAYGGILARASSTGGNLNVNTFPSNATTDYKACTYYQNTYASALTGVEGFYFSVGTDTSVLELTDGEIYLEVFEWNDAWTTLSAGVTYDLLNQVGVGSHVPASNDDNNDVIYQALNAPVILQNNQKYLFCLQTYNPEYFFGAEQVDFNANVAIYDLPVTPINVDGTWYSGQGWNNAAVAIGLKMASNVGLEDFVSVQGSAYPNPANDAVTVSVAAQGNATLSITDISGRTAFNGALDLTTGKATVDMSNLESGMYIFNVTFENGQKSQFNVVKK